jgi:hypothetical protein
MGTNIPVGGSPPGGAGAGGGFSINLDVPLASGEPYSYKVTDAKGDVIGSGSSKNAAGSAANPLTKDSIQSMSQQEALNKLTPSLNISLQWGGANSTAVLQMQLNTLDPANPQVPVIKLYYDQAKGSVSAQNAQTGQTASSTLSLSAPAGQTSGAKSSANSWFTSNAMVAFEITFMEMVNTLMKTKMAEGQVQLKGFSLVMELANDASQCILNAANAQYTQHLAAAVCAGVGMVTTIACTCASSAVSGKMQEEEVVPEKTTPTPTSEVSIKGEDDENVEDEGEVGEEEDEDIPAVTDDDDKVTDETDADDSGEGDVDDVDPKGGKADTVAKKGEAADAADEDKAVDKEGEAKAKADEDKAKAGEDKAEVKDEDAAKEADAGDKKLTRQQVKEKNREIRLQNRKLQNLSQKIQGLRDASTQLSTVISEGVSANTTLIAANANAQKEVIEGVKQVVSTAYLHNMNDAFKSNTDLISQLLGTFDQMHSKLTDAINASLRH